MTPSTFTPAPPPKPNNTPFSWLRLTASLSIVARYTFTIWRGAVRLPTDTVFGRSATEWSPSATELFTAFANIPTATDKALALVFRPNAIEFCCATLSGPIAIAPVYPSFPAEAFAPIAIAIGANASAGKEGYTGAIAIGPDSVAQQNSIALGRNTNASALSVAVGMFANAVNNSVALGDHSVADRPNTVSVGSRTAPRQIVNVYRATMDRDAVNLSQLKGVLFGLGGGAGVNVDGVIQSPTYTIGGKVFNNVNDALASLDSRSSLSDVYLKVDGETQ